MSCYCKCYVALPQGAVGWSAVCFVVFPDHIHLLFLVMISVILHIIYIYIYVMTSITTLRTL